MRLEFKNLGVIKTGNICLNSNLTIFCGPNGTGKTYLAYAIYSLLKSVLRIDEDMEEEAEKSLFSNKPFEIEIKLDALITYQNRLVESLKSNMDSVFAISEEETKTFFKDFSVDFVSTKEQCSDKLAKAFFDFEVEYDNCKFRIQKIENGTKVLVTPNENNSYSREYFSQIASSFILSIIYHHCAVYPNKSAAIFPVERNSIYTFIKELSLSRTNLIDHMHKVFKKEEINPFDLITQFSKRYPQAIKDGLTVADDLKNISKKSSKYKNIAEEIEAELLHGKIFLSKEGEVLFASNGAKSKKLPIHMTASMVKTLSSLIFHLRHSADAGELLIIDEPEMNLHPDNQVLLARIFVKLVNNGLRLLISTHSDYIIREINNMVMASQIPTEKLRDTPYINNDWLLKKEQVAVYYFQHAGTKAKIKDLNVYDNGFDVESIDNTILLQNDTAEELYFNMSKK